MKIIKKYQKASFLLSLLTVNFMSIARNVRPYRAPRLDAPKVKAAGELDGIKRCLGVLQADHETLCDEIEDIAGNLSRHDMIVAEDHERICSKIENLDEDIQDGFEQTETNLDMLEQIVCSKLEKLEESLSCEFVITQADIDAGFTTPFANTVYCLAESVTFSGAPAITIDKDNVILDLHDHVIAGNDSNPCILIDAPTNVIVKDGMLNNIGGTGIAFNSGSSFIKVFNIDANQTPAAILTDSSDHLLFDAIRIFKGKCQIQNSNNIIIKNSRVTQFTDGFRIINSDYCLISECVARDIFRDDLFEAKGFDVINSSYLKFVDCTAENISSADEEDAAGFWLENVISSEFKNCIAKNIEGYEGSKKDHDVCGILMRNSQRLLFENCHVANAEVFNYKLSTSSIIDVNDCSALSTGTAVVAMDDCSRIKVRNSSFLGLAEATLKSGGIGIAESSYIEVSNCKNRGLGAVAFSASEAILITDCSAIGGITGIVDSMISSSPSNQAQIIRNCIIGMVADSAFFSVGLGVGIYNLDVGSTNYQIYGNRVLGCALGGIIRNAPALISVAHNVAVHNAPNYGGTNTPASVIPGITTSYWANARDI